MADNNKKRGGSFRKLFPNLFFGHKSKDKNTSKDSQTNPKVPEFSSGNRYQNPRMIKPDKNAQGSDNSERIYENLSAHGLQSDNETQNNEILSQHSSSSTLVSESAKNRSVEMNESSEVTGLAYKNYTARPQVPPKPYDTGHSPNSQKHNEPINDPNQYPDVYYHSLDKLTDKITPLDEMEIYRASQAQADPAPVGAEIKRVSTKFLISPKKEAEVRTIQPTRARSLSFDNKQDNFKDKKYHTRNSVKEESIKKPYNYSAPTSPIPISHKIPNMPKTVSPYQHVRKIMIENEEKRNSLSRTSIRNTLTTSPRPEYGQKFNTAPKLQESTKLDAINREKTRQTVEAFYWQKLKELKQKEDEYFLRHSLNISRNSANHQTNSNCSTPNSFSFVMEPRSSSLPRGKDLKNYNMNHPIYTSSLFTRGAPERRTDTFIKSRTSYEDPDIIYRHPEKLRQKTPLHNFESTNLDNRTIKRVSFDEHGGKTDFSVKNNSDLKVNDSKLRNKQLHAVKVSETISRVPPRPPVRTTSVGGVGKSVKLGNNKKITHLVGTGHSLCSESESGSEAGEIQRILHSNAQKGKKKLFPFTNDSVIEITAIGASIELAGV
ncbi:unnamed protein product [Arctia plantaginis]|uniref:Uncharacterized protein n=1 Tax=Arctia plantaginis TaxID=874455 RepID=A0A8S1BJ16_ARCPL|nr:unnamed protein product [Arctia plantaginis]